ncbi:2-hydroxy-acid oxidase [Kitasatospora sp. NA04385]|uniref:2-hydroxy-acid oxidase n=1 Tax=Kitasatospora sp. NA04385 TaxID=2742135 RepID=UPI001591F2AB|nr:2-hydroxy-acid oxidase [Kitasatospora sp. NA04385]QKW22920.1 2-hydroxy-acid oxidase [Kitasatospora sp. NA04385]
MRVRGPLPATTLPRTASPLRLTAAHALDLPGHSPLAADPDLRTFTADLTRPYGVELAEDALAGARGQSYAALAGRAIDALVGPDRPVDLLVLVYAVPDVRPGQAVALHLGESCPGEPMSFAICDEGAGAAFSALRIADAYARTGGVPRRALLIAVEQADLHHRPHRPARLPDRHSAAALLWEAAPEPAAPPGRSLQSLCSATEVTDRQIGGALKELCAELPDEAVLLLGPGLTGVEPPPGPDTRTARPGNPYTGGWAALAAALADPGLADRPLALADLEPETGRLDLAHWTAAGAGR